MSGISEARELLAELETFWANDAGDRAIKILRKIVAETAAISSAKLIEQTGGDSGPVETIPFPPELREPSMNQDTGILELVRGELAALIPDPDNPKIEDWPVENPSDAECLQAAYSLLAIANRAA